ncbi:DUF4160 domain-containing protein [Labrys okinawensis]|uniref:DUF4160 domain-containing protein n=1 Tax=Labrys okinawensis TaxID=346911 RepID=UPI0039BC90E2
MGKLYQIGNIIIRVYANDHLPPHFHIVAPDFQALVEIETKRMLKGSIKSSRKEIEAWVSANIETIRAEWNRINPRFPIT